MKRIGLCGLLGAVIFCGFGTVRAEEPDALLKYVESDGATFVDTEIRGRSGTKLETSLMHRGSIYDDLAFVGSQGTGPNTYFLPLHFYNRRACIGYEAFQQCWKFTAENMEFRVASTLEAGNQTLDVNGSRVHTGTTADSFDSGYSMYLFAVNHGGMADYKSTLRCYWLKLWQTDESGSYVLVRDYVPCVKDGVAGLYDRVSKRIFFGRDAANPASPRSLIAGPALPAFGEGFGTRTVKGAPNCYVEYVTSDGNQALDTGLPARAGLRAWADMQWRGSKSPANYTERSLLAAQNKQNEGVYLIHDSYNDGNAADGGRAHRVRFICGTAFWPMKSDGTSYTYEHHSSPDSNPRITVEGDFTDPANVSYFLNGEQIFSGEGTDMDTHLSLALFAANFDDDTTSYRSEVRLYRLKLWLDGEPARDYRPCIKDGEAGLYDAVNDEVIFPAVPFAWTGVGRTVDESGSARQPMGYVESDGTETGYVDTGIIGRSGTKIEADLKYMNTDGDEQVFIGSRVSSSGSDCTRIYPFSCYYGKFAVGYGSCGYSSQLLSADVKYHVASTLEVGNQTLDIDGQRVYTGTDETLIDDGCTMFLFGWHLNGTARKCYNPSKVRCYGLKIWQTDEDGDYRLVRDLRPSVTFNMGGLNAKAGFFDAVSGQSFDTTKYTSAKLVQVLEGDAVKGRPDKYVEYIQATGLQMLDTGVPARPGVKAEGDFLYWSDTTTPQTYLGSCTGPGMIMIHQTWYNAWASFGANAFGVESPGSLRNPDDGSVMQYAPGVKTHFVCDLTDPSRVTLDLDGERVLDMANDPGAASGDTLGLFCCRDGVAGRYPSRTRCYGLKLWLDGALVRDFVPCVKNGRGALYDKVSRRIYFPMGADITEANVGPQVPGPGFQILVR